MSSSRLLYGLAKDGRFLFKNESSYTYELNIDNALMEVFSFNSVYKTINLFVSIKDASNKENQFFFSLNPFYSTVELHDLNNDNINNIHYIWRFSDFFNLNEEDYIFPYECIFLEIPNENTYVIAFIPTINVNNNIFDFFFIKKFRFRAFANDAYEEESTIKYTNYLNSRILNVIFMDGFDFFVVLSFINYYGTGFITLKSYNNDLINSNSFNDLSISTDLNNYLQDDIFFKAIYL